MVCSNTKPRHWQRQQGQAGPDAEVELRRSDTEAIVGLPLRAGETVYIYGAMWYADGCGPFELSVTESAP